ncbi:MAG: HNH endonuclease [Bryobacteraceae bacterium]
MLQRCNACSREFDLTPEFWHRQPKAKSGLSGTCRGCANERARRWHEQNRERALESARAYSARTRFPGSRGSEYEANREHILECHRRHYQQNADALRQKQREYAAANIEKVAEGKRLAHIANREGDNARCRAWASANAEALREKHREYRLANGEEVAERKRLAHLAHREADNARARAWAADNPERVRARSAAYYQRNAEALKRKAREYAAANREKVAERNRLGHLARRQHDNATSRAWKAANPERVRAAVARYRARRHNAPGRITGKDVQAQYETQRGTCFYCPRSLAQCRFHVDHYIPLLRGGSNEPSNIVLACPECNGAKGTKLPWEFRDPKSSVREGTVLQH